MEFRLLGGVEARVDDEVVDLGRRHQRCLLGLLLLEPGRAIPVERLADLLWDGSPPAAARAAIHTYVARLRAGLTRHGVSIVTSRFGYRIDVDPASIDYHRARAAVLSHSTDEDPQACSPRLAAALTQLREPLLAGAATSYLTERISVECQQLRLAGLQRYAEAELANGRPEAAISVLAEVALEPPVREGLVAALMTAYVSSGRTAEALATYRAARTSLIDELGIEPGATLQDLHRDILRVPSPDHTSGSRSQAPEAIRPAQLPPRLVNLLPRSRYERPIVEVADRLASCAETAIVVVSGMGGLGKTSLAVGVAHDLRAAFPDGQLFVDLGGFGLGPPTSPVDALRGLLWALGIRSVPHQLDLAAAFRTATADRCLLIVLDNAATAAQVRPLLPGAGRHLVLITSRDAMAGLAISHNARLIRVDPMNGAETTEMLLRRAEGRLDDQPAATVCALAAACRGLPLAVALVGAELARGDQAAGDILTSLQENALDALRSADPHTDLRTIFSWSYRRLSDSGQRLLRYAAAAPGTDLDAAAAASLLATDPGTARSVIAELTEAHSIEYRAGRLHLHDLVRAYAAEHVGAEETRAVLARLLNFYLHISADLAVGGPLPTLPEPVPVPHERTACEDNLDAIVAVIKPAISNGFRAEAYVLAARCCDPLQRHGRFRDQQRTQLAAIQAAQFLDLPGAAAEAHRGAARAYAKLGDVTAAAAHFGEAAALFEAVNDQRGTARVLQNLAWMYGTVRRYRLARNTSHAAMDLFHNLGDHIGEAIARNAVGWYTAQLGRLDEAQRKCTLALTTLLAHQHHIGAASAYDSIGFIHRNKGEYADAIQAYGRALEHNDASGDHPACANSLRQIGHTHLAAKDPQAARSAWQRAYTILRACNDPTAREILHDLEQLTSLST